MGLADWHHNFRLVPVKVICEDGPEPGYTLLTVYRRKYEDDDTGTRLFDVRASEALACASASSK